MKKAISFITGIFLFAEAFPQEVTGTVFDRVTNEKICCASVYFAGTTEGTLSDKDGRFRISISKHGSMPLTVSAIGYFSATVRDFDAVRPLTVYLDRKVFELDEVVVNARSQARERKLNMTIFRNEFLGTTANALSCIITNEKDIRFRYSEDGDTLKAYSDTPLHILNKALGYEITFFLDNFEYNIKNKSILYEGNPLFREDSTVTMNGRKAVERRRRFAYLGSRMHYFRTLWMNDLNSTGFVVFDVYNKKFGYSDLVYQKDTRTKYLYNHDNLGISYYGNRPSSFVHFSKDTVFFDQRGWFEPSVIVWEGEMSRQRMADTLPFDYIFK